MAEERRKWTIRQLIPVFISNVITIILFVFLYAFINPRAVATEKLNLHETRITVNEANIVATNKELEKLNKNVEKILDILFTWKGGRQQ